MSQLQDWLIARFISRADVVAIQSPHGHNIWSPLREDMSNQDSALIPWSRELLQNHLDSKLTLGHYMLNSENQVKLFAFDIDFDRNGFLPTSYDDDGVPQNFQPADVRAAWLDRANPHRAFMKSQLRMVSHKLAALIYSELEIPTAVAYSGGKGVHVYGFTDTIEAAEARIAAEIVMKAMNDTAGGKTVGANFGLSRGTFEWKDGNPDPYSSFANFTIEVFPKQDEIGGGGFGNLMALPLGTNLKNPQDPKFFVDMRQPMNVLAPCDALWALTTANPWSD